MTNPNQMHKALIKTAAENILIFYIHFLEKIRLEILCESPVLQLADNLQEKPSLILSENNIKKLECCLQNFA